MDDEEIPTLVEEDIPDLIPQQITVPDKTLDKPARGSRYNLLNPLQNKTEKKIPVSIVTGFLGSGKTTFLNYVLTQNHGEKIAVIQNEIGEALKGIEEVNIFGQEGKQENQEWIELPNGCVCCSVKDDLLMTVENLVRQAKFNYIFVECSGLADPGKLAAVFWVDDQLESNVYLDGVITIADSKNLLKHLSVSGTGSRDAFVEVSRQLAFADRILLNKRDLVSEHELFHLTQEIRRINPLAPLLVTERSQVDLKQILNIQALHDEQYFKNSQNWTVQQVNDLPTATLHIPCQDSECSHTHSASDNQDQNEPHSYTRANVFAITLTQTGFVSRSIFSSWLGELLWEGEEEDEDQHLTQGQETTAKKAPPRNQDKTPSAQERGGGIPVDDTVLRNTGQLHRDPPRIYRFKGVLAFQGSKVQHVLQGVHTLFDLEETKQVWPANQTPENRLLFIGRNIDQLHLQNTFAALFNENHNKN